MIACSVVATIRLTPANAADLAELLVKTQQQAAEGADVHLEGDSVVVVHATEAEI